MTNPDSKDLYRDSWTDAEHAQRRSSSAKEHLQRILRDNPDIQPTVILEVGSGAGGVTRALREVFPGVPITAVDRDARAAAAAQELGVEFVAADLLSIPEEELESLTGNVDYICGLRTSVDLAKHLIEQLPATGFSGDLTFSLISETDEAKLGLVVGALRSAGHKFTITPLIEMRGHNERSYTVHFVK